MAEVTLTIDGTVVVAEEGRTVLEAARSLGKEIPTLCHDPRIKPFASCFVCLVEIEGGKGYVPSCATKVAPGMVVRTDTPEIIAARQAALELLVSNHYADCLGPCTQRCPAGVDIQGYIALLAMGRPREAVALIKETNPLPSVCGRVCTRPCEDSCRRNLTGEPVGIDYLKRYAADMDRESAHPFSPRPKASTGRRAAVVGGGPAGLTAAWYLALEGHAVTILEAREKAGGWLRYGIPSYRLPEDVLDYEVDSVLALGVELRTNTALGRDFTVDELFEQGYEAVFLGLGAQKSTLMRIPGEEAEGVAAGIDFLEKVTRGDIRQLDGRVVVVGGGNTAVDAARTALRLGAETVTVLYRRSRSEMPAHHAEIEDMEREGVRLELLVNPIRYNTDPAGRLCGVTCVRMELGEPDASGRRRPVPVPGSEFDVAARWVFGAVGQQVDGRVFGGSPRGEGLTLTRSGTVDADDRTQGTSADGVFAGGDMVTGAATAIEAIAAGKRAAVEIHRRLTGEELPRLRPPFLSRRENLKAEVAAGDLPPATPSARRRMPCLDERDRAGNFREVELGYTEGDVDQEASRCLECGCHAFFDCDLKKWCAAYGVTQKAYPGDFHNDRPVEDHPYVRYDPNKCILCGRCVRICDEVVGASALGFVRRGFDARVRPALEKPLAETSCISCGMCTETCPTGALVAKADAPKPGPFLAGEVPSVCGFCAVGCRLRLETVGGRVLRSQAEKGSDVVAGGLTCRGGRFGFRALSSPDRLGQPLVRNNGGLVPASWAEAVRQAGEILQGVVKTHGPDSVAVLAGPRLTVEEAYLVQQLARRALGTPNVLSFSPGNAAGADLFAHLAEGGGAEGPEAADLAVVVGLEGPKRAPVLEFRLHAAGRSFGTDVYLFRETAGPADRSAKLRSGMKPEEQEAFARALLARALEIQAPPADAPGLADLRRWLGDAAAWPGRAGFSREDLDVLAERLFSGKTAFCLDVETASPGLAGAVYNLIALLKMHGKSPLVYAQFGRCGSLGVLRAGCRPDCLPGGVPAEDPAARERFSDAWGSALPGKPGLSPDDFVRELERGGIRGLVAVGGGLPAAWWTDPRLEKPLAAVAGLVAADLFPTGTTKRAHVVLPMAGFTETDGCYVSPGGRDNFLRAAVPPPAGMSNIDLLAALAEAIRPAVGRPDLGGIRREMALLVPEWGGGGQPPAFRVPADRPLASLGGFEDSLAAQMERLP